MSENAVEKKTKEMYYNELKQMVIDMVPDDAPETKQELIEFIDKRLAELELRKKNAAARAEKKKAEGDILTNQLYDVVKSATSDVMTIEEVIVALNDEEATRAKVTSKLSKLVREGRLGKTEVKVGSKKKIGYGLPEKIAAITTEE